jgi:hypothetical protein
VKSPLPETSPGNVPSQKRLTIAAWNGSRPHGASLHRKQASSQSQELTPKQHVGWNAASAHVAYVKRDDIEREARASHWFTALASGCALTLTGRGGAVRQTSRLFAWAEKDLKIKNMVA